MKTVIFIGHHKVGSTSLQRFLAHNYLPLLQAGILYPSVEGQGLSQNILTALTGTPPDMAAPLNVSEPHNALAFRMLFDAGAGPVPGYHGSLPHFSRMLHDIDCQIAAFAPRAMILCAEVFANFAAADPAPMRALKQALRGHDVDIICTLRRPDDYLVAWHGQRLKFGHKIAALRDGAQQEYYAGIHFDYRLMLDAWAAAFPDARFSLRSYDQVQKTGGAVEDFLRHAGIDFPAALVRLKDANPSLPRALMEIARLANQQLPAPAARDLRDFLGALPRGPLREKNHQVEMFGAENRQALVSKFAAINHYLRRFRPDGTDFFPDLADMAQPRPVPEITAAYRALEHIRRTLSSRPLGPAARDFLAMLKIG